MSTSISTSIRINKRLELADIPRDPLNQLSSIRGDLVKSRNSARLSESRREKLRETLQFVLDTLGDSEENVAPVDSQEPASKPAANKRRATAKIDKSKV
jgi:hypothetical protein